MPQDISHKGPMKAKVNHIEIAYETFGHSKNCPITLIMGLGTQMVFWDEEFCHKLAKRGFFVIRFDNRDIGLSTHLNQAFTPNVSKLIMKKKVVPGDVPYTLEDMADDTVGLLDSLQIETANIVGLSMGGMIGQILALKHPDRVRTLTSIMSTTGDPDLPPPEPKAQRVLFSVPPSDRDGFIKFSQYVWKVISGSRYPVDQDLVRKWAELSYERGLNQEGVARQFAAIVASGSRKEALGKINVPTLIIHGDEDPLFPLQCGLETAKAIPGAKLEVIEGMGHSIPPDLWPKLIDLLASHAV